MEYIESKEDYSCPFYCETDHEHIGIENGFYYGILGTTDSLRLACHDTDEDENGHRCPERQGENIIYIVEQ